MYITFGTKPYGKCDVVPELFYVATWFFHIDYFPLIPLGSKLILGQSGDTYHTIPIPFSFKSLFYAWARATTLITACFFWVIFSITLFSLRAADDFDFILLCVPLLSTALFLFLMLYPRKKMPSYRRALQLAQYCQLNEQAMAALHVLYNRDPLTGQPNPPADFTQLVSPPNESMNR